MNDVRLMVIIQDQARICRFEDNRGLANRRVGQVSQKHAKPEAGRLYVIIGLRDPSSSGRKLSVVESVNVWRLSPSPLSMTFAFEIQVSFPNSLDLSRLTSKPSV